MGTFTWPPAGTANWPLTPGRGRCALLQARLIRSSNRRSDRHVARVFAEPMGAGLTGCADHNPVSRGCREGQGWRSPCALRSTRPDPSQAQRPRLAHMPMRVGRTRLRQTGEKGLLKRVCGWDLTRPVQGRNRHQIQREAFARNRSEIGSHGHW